MAEKSEIDKELETIGRNILVFIGRGEVTRNVLKQMKLAQKDISEPLKKEVRRIAALLSDGKKDAGARIEEARAALEKLSKSKSTPKKISEMILTHAIKRLEEANARLAPKPKAAPKAKEVPGVVRISAGRVTYDLNIFLSEDSKTRLALKKLGITEIPERVRSLAKEAQAMLGDAKLGEKERMIRAADLLMQPMQPAIFGTRERKEIETLQHEIKCMLWEIANNLVVKAQTAKA